MVVPTSRTNPIPGTRFFSFRHETPDNCVHICLDTIMAGIYSEAIPESIWREWLEDELRRCQHEPIPEVWKYQ